MIILSSYGLHTCCKAYIKSFVEFNCFLPSSFAIPKLVYFYLECLPLIINAWAADVDGGAAAALFYCMLDDD